MAPHIAESEMDIGDRMKSQYEDRYRLMLPRRTYTIIRVDGKAFHTFTRGCRKPFDPAIAAAMDAAAMAICREACGAEFAFVESDEASVLLTDFALPTTAAWFDGNVQKLCSVSASVAAMAFNRAYERDTRATFDARVFVIPDPVEVENYFIWRQQDAERNSLAGLCQRHYSPKQLHGKGRSDQHELLHAKGINWDRLPPYWKRGRTVRRVGIGWEVDRQAPVFTRDRAYLQARIPRLWGSEAPAA